MNEQVIPEGYRSGQIIDAYIAEEGENTGNLIAIWTVRLDGFDAPAEGEEFGPGDVLCEHKMFGKPETTQKTRAIFESLGLSYPDDSVEIGPRTIGKRVRVGTFHNPRRNGEGVYVNHYIVLGGRGPRARVAPDQVARAIAKQAGRADADDDLPFDN